MTGGGKTRTQQEATGNILRAVIVLRLGSHLTNRVIPERRTNACAVEFDVQGSEGERNRMRALFMGAVRCVRSKERRG